MKKKWLVLAASSAVLALAACSSNETVATTKAGNITKDELYNAMRLSNGSQALYTLLIQKVADSAVKDKAAVNKQVDEFIASRKATAGGNEAFLQLLKQNGFNNEEEFKKAVYANYVVTQVIKEKTVVTDEEVAAAYENWVPNVTASHILVEDEATAQDIINQLKNGGDWNTLAAAHSKDTANASKGGSLGSFNPSEMVPEFAEALQAMKSGEISQTPVKTTFGYHVIKMENNPQKTSFEQDKETVRASLVEAKTSDTTNQQTIVSELLKTADIKITDEYLKAALNSVLGTPNQSESSTTSTTTNTSK